MCVYARVYAHSCNNAPCSATLHIHACARIHAAMVPVASFLSDSLHWGVVRQRQSSHNGEVDVGQAAVL